MGHLLLRMAKTPDTSPELGTFRSKTGFNRSVPLRLVLTGSGRLRNTLTRESLQ